LLFCALKCLPKRKPKCNKTPHTRWKQSANNTQTLKIHGQTASERAEMIYANITSARRLFGDLVQFSEAESPTPRLRRKLSNGVHVRSSDRSMCHVPVTGWRNPDLRGTTRNRGGGATHWNRESPMSWANVRQTSI